MTLQPSSCSSRQRIRKSVAIGFVLRMSCRVLACVAAAVFLNLAIAVAAPPPKLTALPTASPDASGVVNFSGHILERGTRNPLPFSELGLDATSAVTITDDKGRFSFRDVSIGKHTLSVVRMGYKTVRTEVVIVDNERTEVTLFLEKESYNDYSVTVRTQRAKQVVTRHVLERSEIERLPGTNGDTIKVVSVLPGVARIPMGLGGSLIVRGADDQSSAAVVDGTFIPYMFHLGGVRSVLNSGLVADVAFYPGNMGVFYHNVMGGVLDARTRLPKTDRLHIELDLNVFEGGLLVEGPLADNLSVMASVHRNWHDLILGAVWPDDADTSFAAAPVYYDYQVKLHWKINDRQSLTLFSFGSDDRMKLLVGSGEVTDVAFGMKMFFHRVNLTHRWRPLPKLTNTFTPSVLYFDQDGEFFARHYLRMHDLHVAVRDDLTWSPTERIKLNAGVRMAWEYMPIAIAAPHLERSGETGGSLFDPPTSETRVAEETINSPTVGAYAELALQPVSRVEIVAGGRADYNQFNGDIDPSGSLTVRFSATDKTVLKSAVGTYTRFPWGPEVLEGYGNPDLKNERSVQYAVGVEQVITDQIRLDTTLFYQQMHRLVVSNPAFNTDPLAPPYSNDGKGRAYGLELMLKHTPSKYFSGWLSYTLSRSERKFPGQSWKLFALDQSHILAAVGMVTLPANWTFGFRFRLVSGNPRTLYNGQAGFDADMGLYLAPEHATTTERSPLVHTLDLRLDKTFVFDRLLWTLYLDVQNVYCRRNIEGIAWNFDYTEYENVKGLSILPAIGTRIVF